MTDFIAFIQPIIALMFIIAGSSILVLTWAGWVFANRASFQTWLAFAINHSTAVMLVLTGFFIAHW